jgi:hypothetical protein
MKTPSQRMTQQGTVKWMNYSIFVSKCKKKKIMLAVVFFFRRAGKVVGEIPHFHTRLYTLLSFGLDPMMWVSR